MMYPASTLVSRKSTQSAYESKPRLELKSVLPTKRLFFWSHSKRACILAGSQLTMKSPCAGG